MQAVFDFIRGIFRTQKLNIFLVFVFAGLFFVLMFPFNDLSDLATTKISDASGGSVYLQFDKMAVNFLPLGLQLENVSVENAQLPAINLSSLSVSPWIVGALVAKLGGTVDATGLFKGNVHLVVHEGSKTGGTGKTEEVELQADEVALPLVSEYLRSSNILALNLQGSLSINGNVTVDPTFKDQPKGTLGANAVSFALPGQSVMTTMGPLQTPPLKLGAVQFKGKLGGGRLEIEDMTFGGKNLDLGGKIKGELGVMFQADGRGGIQPVISTYDLHIDLNASKNFMDPSVNPASGLIGGFLGQFRSETPQGSHFAFRMKQPKIPGQPPELLPYQ